MVEAVADKPEVQLAQKFVSFRARAKGFKITTIRWKGTDNKTQINEEIFVNYLLTIPNDEEIQEGKERPNKERIKALRDNMARDPRKWFRETDLEKEAAEKINATKRIGDLETELKNLKAQNAALRGQGAQVSKV